MYGIAIITLKLTNDSKYNYAYVYQNDSLDYSEKKITYIIMLFTNMITQSLLF